MYQSFKELERDIKTAQLKRGIALEELKLTKQEFSDSFSTSSWMGTVFSAVKKYGILYLIRRILK